MAHVDIPVLIVGGGPAGLSTALCLGRLGVPSLLVERRSGLSLLPKARGVTIRTVELMRAWGLATAVRAASLAGEGHRFVYVGRSLADPAARRVVVDDSPPDALSPERGAICAQSFIEPLLATAARATSLAELRFGWELTGFEQDGAGVRAELRELRSDQTLTVTARYLVAADGGRSAIRATLGVATTGEPDLGRNLHVLIAADLDQLLGARPCRFFFIDDAPRFRGMVAPAGAPGRWLVNLLLPPGQEPPRDPKLHAAIVRNAIGEEWPFELIEALPWTASGLVAERMRVGHVFLVGDAAHVMTPAGGFGMNTAIQDAHNLAWKLAAVLAGHATPALLESYAVERLPVGRSTVALSVTRLRSLNISGAADTVNEVSVGLDLGFTYAAGALLPDGTMPPVGADPVAEYRPVARPGHRAPHCWLDGARVRSTLDLFGERFVLLAGPRGHAWLGAAGRATAQRPVQLAAHVMAGVPNWCELYGVDQDGAVLVRPDGVVAWRQPSGAADGGSLAVALTRLLGHAG